MSQRKETTSVFHWNAGGWFGSQLGASCWMLICAVLVLPENAAIAAAVLALFLVPNIVGTALWMGRDRRAAYPAIQILIAACWLAALTTVFVIKSAGLWPAVEGVDVGGGGTVSASAMTLLLLVMFPAIMVWFHVLHRRGSQPRAY